MIKENLVLDVKFSSENATEPVTTQEVKDWCRIDVADDDTIIAKIIKASRIRLERATNISFITRTVKARLNNSLGRSYFPYGPVTALTTIIDEDGDAIDSGNYTLFNDSFQQIDSPYNDIITVTYTAGYSALPEDMREDLLNQIAFAYENRGDVKMATKLSPLLSLSYSRI